MRKKIKGKILTILFFVLLFLLAIVVARLWGEPVFAPDFERERLRFSSQEADNLTIRRLTPHVTGFYAVGVYDVMRVPLQRYRNVSVLTPAAVSVVGTGISWLVRVRGGTCVFRINRDGFTGDTITLFDGEGIGDDFNFTNPTISVVSLTAGATVQVYIRYR